MARVRRKSARSDSRPKKVVEQKAKKTEKTAKKTAPGKTAKGKSSYDWESAYKKVNAHLDSSSSCKHFVEDLVIFLKSGLCPNYTRTKLTDMLTEKYGKSSIRIEMVGKSKKRVLCLGKRNCKCQAEDE